MYSNNNCFQPSFAFQIVREHSNKCPFQNQDPLQGIYDAVFRPNKRSESSASEPNEFGVDPFLPDERLTLEEAVRMYSAGGAFAAGMEDKLGAIEEGFMADLTIVEVEGGAEALLENPRSAISVTP